MCVLSSLVCRVLVTPHLVRVVTWSPGRLRALVPCLVCRMMGFDWRFARAFALPLARLRLLPQRWRCARLVGTADRGVRAGETTTIVKITAVHAVESRVTLLTT